MAKKAAKKLIRVTLRKSGIGYPVRQKRTLAALGLKTMNQTVSVVDNAAVRGMITKVSHLVEIESGS
ncbi:MAG: 50S ribosomal protein L30 [Anaerolineaceae bacterium]|nr:50S ribosomal protein L30 [Anaerolineaceae bacterium]